VIGKQGSDGYSVVFELNCLTLGDVTRDGGESIVGGREDSDIGGGGQCVCETIYKTHEREEGAEVRLRRE
jgi:hypothetical protein